MTTKWPQNIASIAAVATCLAVSFSWAAGPIACGGLVAPEKVGSSTSALTSGPTLVATATAWSQPAARLDAMQAQPCQCNIVLDPSGLCKGTIGGSPIAPNDALSLPLANFEGLSNANSCLADGTDSAPNNDGAPTDDSGMIGPNDFVQTTNEAIAVYDRQGNLRSGFPVSTATLFSGLGTQCGGFFTDATVMYDQHANRWVIERFAGGPNNSQNQCFAVSNTPDPAGTYTLYAFTTTNTPNLFGDYPKTGIWPDGYYMTANRGIIRSGNGILVAVFDRVNMLAGGACPGPHCPEMVTFAVTEPVAPAGQIVSTHMLPAFADGPTLPPSGSPNFLAKLQDHTLGFAADSIQIFEARVNWTNPLASTLATTTNVLPPGGFNTNVCPGTPVYPTGPFPDQNCLPQPSDAGAAPNLSVDAAGVLMYRLVYRNWGTYESLVLNHTVAAASPPAIRAGIQWYELRRIGGGAWTIFQQGTHSPDPANRHMGSIGMDGKGNIAFDYVVQGTGTFPSIRYAGRLATDPLNTLPEMERSLAEGTGFLAQSNNTELAFADYSELSLDPTDDCTFWVTNTYIPSTSDTSPAHNNWHTRVGSFRFKSCAPACAPNCTNGSGCNSGNNCQSLVCNTVNNVCIPPSCAPTCNRGNPCGANSDCGSGVCSGGQCQPSACSPKCIQGGRCGDNSDCESFVCTNNVCAPPPCSPTCNQGAACGANGDCGSQVCTNGQCQPPACSPHCARGGRCNNNGDCTSHVCANNRCN